jgi:predicted metal-dependent peptidase
LTDQFFSRSRHDRSGLGRWTRKRDRDYVEEELLAEEEPESITIRHRLPPQPKPAGPVVAKILGLAFADSVWNKNLPPRVPEALRPIWHDIELRFDYENVVKDGYMCLNSQGQILIQPYKEATYNEWHYYFLHLLYHVAKAWLHPPAGHPEPDLWRYACETLINRQIAVNPPNASPAGFPGAGSRTGGFFRRPDTPSRLPRTPDEQIAFWKQSRAKGESLPNFAEWVTPAGPQVWDVLLDSPTDIRRYQSMYIWNTVKNLKPQVSRNRRYANGPIERAYKWVNYQLPLLSAVASEFELDYDHAAKYNIVLGAVSAQDQIIFVNPAAPLTELEWRWVLVHEILHVVLEHHKRREERDPLLWNVACDYVINNWLEQMGVGMQPEGVLYKREYLGRDAESIYEELLKNGGNDQLKLTFRGQGLSDILDFDEQYQRPDGHPPRPSPNNPFSRQASVREMTKNNVKKMMEQDGSPHRYKGDLPGDLVQELDLGHLLGEAIQIPEWKAELANWLDLQLTPRQVTRSYSRLNRRQSATPHIPLAGRAMQGFHSPTFGVILDTSGSMSQALLQQGLAAVVAFSERHGVAQVRLVMCDTQPYDEGFIPLETLKRTFRVYGRGGTILQPAVTLLQDDDNFPAEAPILIVTDGAIDALKIEREHAFLLPGNGRLPFEAQGPVFRILGEARPSFGNRLTRPPSV